MQDEGNKAPPDDQHQGDEERDFSQRYGECSEDISDRQRGIAGCCCSTAFENTGQGRQQYQRQHHGEVFDNQPADGDAPAVGFDQAALLQRADQHDGAGDR